MSNDVVVVAIPKELRDQLVWLAEHNHGLSMNDAKALRTAPETVSLEGVERSLESLASLAEGGIIGQHLADFPGLVGRKIRRVLSDLRRLVAPVQPVGPIDGIIITEKLYEEICNWFESNPDKSTESLLVGLAVAQKHRRNA